MHKFPDRLQISVVLLLIQQQMTPFKTHVLDCLVLADVAEQCGHLGRNRAPLDSKGHGFQSFNREGSGFSEEERPMLLGPTKKKHKVLRK